MNDGELGCVHGVLHSFGIHGCDGCCSSLIPPADFISEEYSNGFTSGYKCGKEDGETSSIEKVLARLKRMQAEGFTWSYLWEIVNVIKEETGWEEESQS